MENTGLFNAEGKALSIADVMAILPIGMVNRIEVIDEKGRSYVNWKKYLCPCRNRSTKDCLTTKSKIKMKSLIQALKQAWHKYRVGGQFKDDRPPINENDWYYNTKWFSKYFCDKLKRKTMNIIYKLYSSIEEVLLEKYLVEFYFFTAPSNTLESYNKKHRTMYRGDFKCYLPILFMVKNYDELEALVSIVNGQLIKEYGCSIIQTNISDKIGSEEMIKHKINTSIIKLKGYETGVLDIMTFTPQPTDKPLEIKYKTKEDRYTFQIIKTGRMELLKDNFNYTVQFYKTTTEE